MKATATSQQNKETVSEYAALTKMQRVPFATYPIPLPSHDSHTGEALEDDDLFQGVEVCEPEDMVAAVKWYDSDEDSYDYMCPNDKNIIARGLQQ